MRKNVGTADKIVRFIIATILITLLVTHTITGAKLLFAGWALVATLVLTGLDGTCPLYILLGISTRGREKTSH